MRRRDVLKMAGLGAASLALPRLRHAQPNDVKLVGTLIAGREGDPVSTIWADAVGSGLANAGWVEGQNVHLERRFNAGGDDGGAALSLVYAAELAAMNPDVFVCGTTRNSVNVRDTAPGKPIVFVAVVDPVADGLVEDIANPGGLVTGITHMPHSVAGKWLDLLLEIAPEVTEIGFIYNSIASHGWQGRWHVLVDAIEGTGMKLTAIDVQSVEEIGPAIDDLASRPNTGLIVPNNNWLHSNREYTLDAVDRNHLPTIYSGELYANDGGVRRQRPWDRLGGLNKRGFLAHLNPRGIGDETEHQSPESIGREGREGHPAGDSSAVRRRREDPDRSGGPARRGQYR